GRAGRRFRRSVYRLRRVHRRGGGCGAAAPYVVRLAPGAGPRRPVAGRQGVLRARRHTYLGRIVAAVDAGKLTTAPKVNKCTNSSKRGSGAHVNACGDRPGGGSRDADEVKTSESAARNRRSPHGA